MIQKLSVLVSVLLMLSGIAFAKDRSVVVELYSSQGCSACPPADAYFQKELAGRSDIIALSLHVDYWDYIGWKDSFADPSFTARQKLYAKAAGHRTVYTPQMIVNGEHHVVGTHPDQIEKLIRSQKKMRSLVDLSISKSGDDLFINATSGTLSSMQIHVVRYKPKERVDVKRGENAGRVLTYGNIVEDWEVISDWDGQAPLELKTKVQGDAPIVVLVQEENGGIILAAERLR
ncbi:DUF1223 domain-containing protein [Pseudopelagicola sp. nBUS_19]|uniref:DUF1223 domain-containing protein n=1 Tax=unclassified Pseudopelagicola TaxID=2649563 RepID=UPI003EBDEA01